MKKYTLIALFLGFSFAGFFQTAKAQSFEKFHTEIPFAFSIGDEAFEAGKYTIYKIKSISNPQLFQLVDKDNKVLKNFTARTDYDFSSKREADVSLVFTRNGEIRSLSGINDRSKLFSFEVKQTVPKAGNKKSRIKNSSVALPEKI